ncbi:MAG: radical SAM protein [Polyangiaceae bacterium]|jgi:radical SAM protein with 4Fe4S-binding SPASM domain
MKAAIRPRINLENRTPLQEVIPLATPITLFVDPASACNFQCTFCPTGDREAIAETGRYQGTMKLPLFKKVIDDLAGFEKSVRVLRLYKDGEPFLNKNLAAMIAYAKASGRVDTIDTTTNGSLLDPERVKPVLDAGLDRINISVDGMTKEQYRDFTRFEFDFEAFVKNVAFLYEHRGQCEVAIKVPGDLLTEEQKALFLRTFGDLCDRIFIENFAPCWPEFDVESRTGVTITKGIYEQPTGDTDTCPYIFYSMSVNADGLVSSCFLDWGRKLVIGDVRQESLPAIWRSDKMNELRLLHLEGRRREHPVCGNCGQLSHCLPDNIDAHRPKLLERMRKDLGASRPAAREYRRLPLLDAKP